MAFQGNVDQESEDQRIINVIDRIQGKIKIAADLRFVLECKGYSVVDRWTAVNCHTLVPSF